MAAKKKKAKPAQARARRGAPAGGLAATNVMERALEQVREDFEQLRAQVRGEFEQLRVGIENHQVD